MKLHLPLILRSALLAVVVGTFGFTVRAEDTTYTGDSGGWWEDSGNWSAGEPTSEGTVTISNNRYVVVGNDAGNRYYYGYTIVIEEGSKLSFLESDVKLWGSTITVGSAGALEFQEAVWGDYRKGVTGAGAPL